MTATLEETQSDLLKLLNLVQQGEEVAIASQGRAVAKLSAVSPSCLASLCFLRDERAARLQSLPWSYTPRLFSSPIPIPLNLLRSIRVHSR